MNQRKLWTITLVILAALAGAVLPVAAQDEGQVGGIVYNDKNGNGIREEGEQGIGGVSVELKAGDWSTTLTTAPDGTFSVALNPATWSVTVTPPTGYTAPNPTQEAFIAAAGDVVSNLELGLVPDPTATDDKTFILPESGAALSSEIVIGGLVGILALGIALVVVGQRRRGE